MSASTNNNATASTNEAGTNPSLTQTSSPASTTVHPTPPATPTQASGTRIDTHANDRALVEERLATRDDFLGNREIVNHLKWFEDETVSNADILKWAEDGDLALLSTIGQVTPERVKLGPLGNWDAKYGKPMSDAKLQFTLGGVVDSPPLNDAHNIALQVLAHLQQLGAQTQQHNHLIVQHRGRPCIRLSMPIWVPRDQVYDPQGKDSKDPGRFWPVPAAARSALEEILENFQLNHIRIYDIDGTVIPPTVMATRLVGAVVEVWFSIQHFTFGNSRGERASDTFTGKLFQLRVLRRPNTGAGSPFGSRTLSDGPWNPPSSPSRFGNRSGAGTPSLSRTPSVGSVGMSAGMQTGALQGIAQPASPSSLAPNLTTFFPAPVGSMAVRQASAATLATVPPVVAGSGPQAIQGAGGSVAAGGSSAGREGAVVAPASPVAAVAVGSGQSEAGHGAITEVGGRGEGGGSGETSGGSIVGRQQQGTGPVGAGADVGGAEAGQGEGERTQAAGGTLARTDVTSTGGAAGSSATGVGALGPAIELAVQGEGTGGKKRNAEDGSAGVTTRSGGGASSSKKARLTASGNDK